MKRNSALWFPRSSVGTHTGHGLPDCSSRLDKPVCVPTPEFGNQKQATNCFPRPPLVTRSSFRSQTKLLCAVGLLLCTACQPAFIGIDSDADIAAENCYAYRYGDKLRPINFTQAFDWCFRSARWGNPHSQTLLGELYYLGLGGEQDWPQAAHWFEIAAKQGHAHAQYMLYRIYGVSEDLAQQEQAEYWLQQARASGYKLAQ